MKFQKSVDLGGIYFAKVELTLKFDHKKEYYYFFTDILTKTRRIELRRIF